MSDTPTSKRRVGELAWSALVYLAATAAVAWWYVNEPLRPLVGGGDTNQFEYASFHLAEHLRLVPWPRLELHSDVAFYPYGVKHVFETWAFEQNFLTGFLWQWLGPGPWIKWHWLAGLFIGAWGTFLLARTQVGFFQALVLGFMASFANYYLFLKYPDHICYASCHWTTLAILTDSLIARSLLVAGRLPLGLLLLRGLLTVLALGHDLAYTAGISLTSLAVHAAWLTALGAVRLARTPHARDSLHNGSQALLAEVRRPSKAALGIGAVTLIIAFFYVPLAGQLAAESTNFPHVADRDRLADLRRVIVAPTSAWRLLLPYFPGCNPQRPPFSLGDMPEQLGMGTVGWAFLAIAGAGLVSDRRHWPVAVPLVALLAIFASFSPTFDWLRMLPWLRFTRACGRMAVAYPAICVALGLGCVWRWPARATQWALAGAFAALLAVELIVGHSISDDLSQRPTPPASFYRFMDTVREAPGEAVLEWPFVVAGGSGTYNALDVFYETNSTTSTYRRFHHKKCPGHYFGRLLPTQARPFLEAGWDHMLMPDGNNIFEPRRQRTHFDETQWQFFSDFYLANDFCGILLYPDRLAPGDDQEFYRRFGRPVAETTTAWNGRMVFIRKRPGERRQVDPARGRAVRLEIPEVYDTRGAWAILDEQPQQALAWFEEALKLEPRRWTSLAGMAQAYRAMSQPDRAEQYLLRAEMAKRAAESGEPARP